MIGKLSVLFVAAGAVLAGGVRADLKISDKATQNMSCANGVCTPTARKAVLNVSDLANMLASGDVSVNTAGSLAKDIDLSAALSWASTSRLTLDAFQSVTVNKPVSVTGTGALTITTNDGGADGDLYFFGKGNVSFWDLNSSLVINGNGYTLVGDIKTLADDIANNPSGSYALAKDYDANADGTYVESPVHMLFEGVLEGLGNQITSLSIRSSTRGDVVAFISATDSASIVRNLEITKASVYASAANDIAVLVGTNFGEITRCKISGEISFPVTVHVGGLVAYNAGSITSSSADARIAGSGSLERIGGLVGLNDAAIASSYALHGISMKSSGESNVGGLAGESSGTIQNSFAHNNVADRKHNDNSSYGGLVGRNDAGAQIASAYAAGKITAKSPVIVGGLIGSDDAAPGSIRHSYWDLDMGVSDPSQGAGNIDNDPGIRGLTTAQLQSGLPKGFDPKIWLIKPNINDGFPYLRAVPPK